VVEVGTQESPLLLTRWYDVRDLVVDEEDIEDLVMILREATMDSHVWGRDHASYREYRRRFIIRETPENHEKILALLRVLREQAGERSER
jgi:hypothetical protein